MAYTLALHVHPKSTTIYECRDSQPKYVPHFMDSLLKTGRDAVLVTEHADLVKPGQGGTWGVRGYLDEMFMNSKEIHTGNGIIHVTAPLTYSGNTYGYRISGNDRTLDVICGYETWVKHAPSADEVHRMPNYEVILLSGPALGPEMLMPDDCLDGQRFPLVIFPHPHYAYSGIGHANTQDGCPAIDALPERIHGYAPIIEEYNSALGFLPIAVLRSFPNLATRKWCRGKDIIKVNGCDTPGTTPSYMTFSFDRPDPQDVMGAVVSGIHANDFTRHDSPAGISDLANKTLQSTKWKRDGVLRTLSGTI